MFMIDSLHPGVCWCSHAFLFKGKSVPALVEVCQYWHWHGIACIVFLGGVGERGEEIQLGNWIQG